MFTTSTKNHADVKDVRNFRRMFTTRARRDPSFKNITEARDAARARLTSEGMEDGSRSVTVTRGTELPTASREEFVIVRAFSGVTIVATIARTTDRYGRATKSARYFVRSVRFLDREYKGGLGSEESDSLWTTQFTHEEFRCASRYEQNVNRGYPGGFFMAERGADSVLGRRVSASAIYDRATEACLSCLGGYLELLKTDADSEFVVDERDGEATLADFATSLGVDDMTAKSWAVACGLVGETRPCKTFKVETYTRPLYSHREAGTGDPAVSSVSTKTKGSALVILDNETAVYFDVSQEFVRGADGNIVVETYNDTVTVGALDTAWIETHGFDGSLAFDLVFAEVEDSNGVTSWTASLPYDGNAVHFARALKAINAVQEVLGE